MPVNRNKTRAHYIHRISYTTQERIVGTFVLTAVILLVWLTLSSQKTQNLFEDDITLYATMSSIQAVNKNTNVIISGLDIGTVTDVNIDDSNQVIITMSILEKYQKLIRADSVAELLNFKFALLGKSVIEISVGSPNQPIIKDGSYITIKESVNLVKLVAKFEPVLITLQDSIKRINEILQAIDPEQVGATINNLSTLSKELTEITQQIKQGKGLAGSALFNDDIKDDVVESTQNLKQITIQTRSLMGQTSSVIDQTKILLQSIQQQVNDMPELTDKVKPLLEEVGKTVKATQQIWPLSSSMPDVNRQTLTSPVATE